MPTYFIAHLVAAVLLAVSIPAGAQSSTPVKSFRDCPDCPEMVTISPGTFVMGASNEEADRFKREASMLDRWLARGPGQALPRHSVVFSQAFAIGKYPVTRGEFAKFVHETGYGADTPCTIHAGRRHLARSGANWNHPGFDQEDRDPVVCVTWTDANAYIGWLNKKNQSSAGTGKSGLYRLPSEAEYEYAARGGTTTLRWWGDDIGRNKAVCDGCGSQWDRGQPAPVGLFGANQYGVYDILGNIWEWTQDCWNKNYEQAPTDGSPWLTGNCKRRVMRGGSFESWPGAESSEWRSSIGQNNSEFSVGFRVAKSLQ